MALVKYTEWTARVNGRRREDTGKTRLLVFAETQERRSRVHRVARILARHYYIAALIHGEYGPCFTKMRRRSAWPSGKSPFVRACANRRRWRVLCNCRGYNSRSRRILAGPNTDCGIQYMHAAKLHMHAAKLHMHAAKLHMHAAKLHMHAATPHTCGGAQSITAQCALEASNLC